MGLELWTAASGGDAQGFESAYRHSELQVPTCCLLVTLLTAGFDGPAADSPPVPAYGVP
jgi:hypothetical protein